jgi:hypothetical protein
MTDLIGVTEDAAGLQRRRPKHVAILLALIPVSVLIALVVLVSMAASSASATGGCGGG